MQFTTAILSLLATTGLVAAYYDDLHTRDLYADEHLQYRRDEIADAAEIYLEARELLDFHKRMGGNGDCQKQSKSSGKIHCMKNGRSCSSKGCSTVGVGCLCDAGFTG